MRLLESLTVSCCNLMITACITSLSPTCLCLIKTLFSRQSQAKLRSTHACVCSPSLLFPTESVASIRTPQLLVHTTATSAYCTFTRVPCCSPTRLHCTMIPIHQSNTRLMHYKPRAVDTLLLRMTRTRQYAYQLHQTHGRGPAGVQSAAGSLCNNRSSQEQDAHATTASAAVLLQPLPTLLSYVVLLRWLDRAATHRVWSVQAIP
jgi:hypothetical protein